MNPTKEEIKKDLQGQIANLIEENKPMDVVSFHFQEGVIMTGQEAQTIVDIIDESNNQYSKGYNKGYQEAIDHGDHNTKTPMNQLAQYLADQATIPPFYEVNELTMFFYEGSYVDAKFYREMGVVKVRVNSADNHGIEFTESERLQLQEDTNKLIMQY